MSVAIAEDQTAAAVLAAVPCYPVPPRGCSPAIDELRRARAGQGLAVGSDGVMLILRRPWLELDMPVSGGMVAYLPYGAIGAPKADLRCGLIPRALIEQVLEHFHATLPNEAAAFVIWNDVTGEFAVEFPAIDAASPSRLVYRTPALAPDWHVVCDIHSHGRANAFFSATDDADDAHSTKIAVVIGKIDDPDGPVMASRLCVAGMFLPLPRSPFSGENNAA